MAPVTPPRLPSALLSHSGPGLLAGPCSCSGTPYPVLLLQSHYCSPRSWPPHLPSPLPSPLLLPCTPRTHRHLMYNVSPYVLSVLQKSTECVTRTQTDGLACCSPRTGPVLAQGHCCHLPWCLSATLSPPLPEPRLSMAHSSLVQMPLPLRRVPTSPYLKGHFSQELKTLFQIFFSY